jgi:hypothetical protein
MSSLKAFLRDYLRFNYSVPEIVERYIEGFFVGMVPKMRFLPLSVRSVVKCSSLESNP